MPIDVDDVKDLQDKFAIIGFAAENDRLPETLSELSSSSAPKMLFGSKNDPKIDFAAIGRTFVKVFSTKLQSTICGEEGADTRSKLYQAMAAGTTTLTAFIAIQLGVFGLTDALISGLSGFIAGAIVNSGVDGVCAAWETFNGQL